MKPEPIFTASQFTSHPDGELVEQFPEYSAAGKARFANTLATFVLSGFERAKWTTGLYRSLSSSFGHLAEYSADEFYGSWFADDAKRSKWIDRVIRYSTPYLTHSDVERAFASWLRDSGMREQYADRFEKQIETAERAELARLKAKYEPTST